MLILLMGCLSLTYFTFKCSTGRPVTLQIESTATRLCPVHAMRIYLGVRGDAPGPLFVHVSGRPISTLEFSEWFSLAISSLKVHGHYTPIPYG